MPPETIPLAPHPPIIPILHTDRNRMETDCITKAIFVATAVLTRLESARRLCYLTIVHLSRRHYTNKI